MIAWPPPLLPGTRLAGDALLVSITPPSADGACSAVDNATKATCESRRRRRMIFPSAPAAAAGDPCFQPASPVPHGATERFWPRQKRLWHRHYLLFAVAGWLLTARLLVTLADRSRALI